MLWSCLLVDCNGEECFYIQRYKCCIINCVKEEREKHFPKAVVGMDYQFEFCFFFFFSKEEPNLHHFAM